jgi:hypothetical protein
MFCQKNYQKLEVLKIVKQQFRGSLSMVEKLRLVFVFGKSGYQASSFEKNRPMLI